MIIGIWPPLRYADLRLKSKERKPDIVFNNLFNAAMKRVKADPELCQANYLDPHKKSGQKIEFYPKKQSMCLLRSMSA